MDEKTRRKTFRHYYEREDGFTEFIRILLCVVLICIAVVLAFMSLTWHLDINDPRLSPKPAPYKQTIDITSEQKPEECSGQTLYYLYTAGRDGAVTGDRYSKDGTINVRFDDKAMYLQYGWDDSGSTVAYDLLTDGTYSRYDWNVKSWQERVVVKSDIGRIYFMEDKGGKQDVLVFSTAKEDITFEKENGDDIVRSFYSANDKNF